MFPYSSTSYHLPQLHPFICSYGTVKKRGWKNQGFEHRTALPPPSHVLVLSDHFTFWHWINVEDLAHKIWQVGRNCSLTLLIQYYCSNPHLLNDWGWARGKAGAMPNLLLFPPTAYGFQARKRLPIRRDQKENAHQCLATFAYIFKGVFFGGGGGRGEITASILATLGVSSGEKKAKCSPIWVTVTVVMAPPEPLLYSSYCIFL